MQLELSFDEFHLKSIVSFQVLYIVCSSPKRNQQHGKFSELYPAALSWQLTKQNYRE